MATEGTQQSLQQGRGKCKLEQRRRDLEEGTKAEDKQRWKEGVVPGGLSCSQAAVVKTSPKGSRETGTKKARLPGERGEGERTGSAKIPLQDWLNGEPWLPQRRTVGGQCCAGGKGRKFSMGVKVDLELGQGLDQRKHVLEERGWIVQTCASLPR